jgi:hypothetical protein
LPFDPASTRNDQDNLPSSPGPRCSIAFRWLVRIVAGLLALSLVAGLLLYWFLSRSLIDYGRGFRGARHHRPGRDRAQQ